MAHGSPIAQDERDVDAPGGSVERRRGNKVVALGELLVDFVPLQTGCALEDVESFERAAGGAPANVAAAVARLGGCSEMISQVGEDAFGAFLLSSLQAEGVDTRWVFRTARANTGLAFVSVDAGGERDFAFYRNPSADLFLCEEQIVPAMFTECAVLHFCSVDLVDWPVKAAHRRAIELARQAGAIVSFDPNVRLPLWDCPESCRAAIREFLPFADVVKLSDDEVEFVTGCASERDAVRKLLSLGCRLVIVTRAACGSAAYTRAAEAQATAPSVQVVDTTGAGDSFVGSFLFQLARDGVKRHQLDALPSKQLASYLEFSSRYAALTVQHEGAWMATMADLSDTGE